MSDLIIYKWRVYCVTEGIYKYTWRDENQGPPTLCPTNSSDTIDAGQNRISEVRNPHVVKIQEEYTPTGGNFFLESIEFDAAPNTTTTHQIMYPFPINVNNADIFMRAENLGDVVRWEVAPNTIVGAATADVSISDTVINVSGTVTDNIQTGFFCNLFDGVNTSELGRVLSVDKGAGTITVETAADKAFLAASPTYVRMTLRYVDMEFIETGKLSVGEGKIGSSYLPANTPIYCSYINNSLSDVKRFVSYMQYLY